MHPETMRNPGNYDTLLLQFTCENLVVYFFDKKGERQVVKLCITES
jgi:hypothetical protein